MVISSFSIQINHSFAAKYHGCIVIIEGSSGKLHPAEPLFGCCGIIKGGQNAPLQFEPQHKLSSFRKSHISPTLEGVLGIGKTDGTHDPPAHAIKEYTTKRRHESFNITSRALDKTSIMHNPKSEMGHSATA